MPTTRRSRWGENENREDIREIPRRCFSTFCVSGDGAKFGCRQLKRFPSEQDPLAGVYVNRNKMRNAIGTYEAIFLVGRPTVWNIYK